MGMWAEKPWDNDSAADWYGDLMDDTNLRKNWLVGINKNPLDQPDVVRAAASLFLMLGRVYIWPINDYDQDLDLAIKQLKKVAEYDEYQDVPELMEMILGEIEELESRIKKSTATSLIPKKTWWKFW